MIYDVIIIGAGAAGLYAAAQLAEQTTEYEKPLSVLVLEQTKRCGVKLLMSGSGQCNLTHDGSIKDFISCYGENGKRIRSCLYAHSNEAVCFFFKNAGVSLFKREDGKIFPESLSANDIKNALLDKIQSGSRNNCFIHIATGIKVSDISFSDLSVPDNAVSRQHVYTVTSEDSTLYSCKNLIIAAGGCSYPTSGSDGSIFPILEKLGLEIVPAVPALVPVYVQDYPFSELSGISFEDAVLKLPAGKTASGSLLLTHSNLSGPLILDNSRYLSTGDTISVSYLGSNFSKIDTAAFAKEMKLAAAGSKKEFSTFAHSFISENYTVLPKRFIEIQIARTAAACSTDASMLSANKASSVPGKVFDKLAALFTNDKFSVSGKGGFNIAMATAGGVSLDEINLKTMETKKYPHLFIIGECLDVDGDTGGYNLQFAFSSAYAAANFIIKQF